MSTNNTKYHTLEEAINAMIEDKAGCPWSVAFLYPADNDLYQQWEINNYNVATNSSYSNIPLVYILDEDDMDDNSMLEKMKSDLVGYVAERASQIKQLYGLTGNEGWELSYIDINEDGNHENVMLVIEPQYADKVESLLRKFNEECNARGFKTKLKLNRDAMMIEGDYYHKEGGFFNRMKINSENKKAHKAFRDFLKSLDPYLWKLTKH